MWNFIDITWQKFWRLTVLEYKNNSKWLCKCECWVEKIMSVRWWKTKSCWCYQKESAKKLKTVHWLRYHPMYKTWISMNERCYNVNHKRFHNYGWRWILVCDRWRSSFQFFYDDMLEWYTKWLELDRKDNSKWYSPDNCRWVTSKDNNRNRRNNRIVTYRWENKCIAEWCEVLWLNYNTILTRLYRWWEIERAFIK